MSDCLIALGGNLSTPKVTFQLAVAMLCEKGFRLHRKSGVWHSPAWPPGGDQPDFLNAVISGEYDREPDALMALLLDIETSLGRERSVPNAPRTLDLDLLTFGLVKMKTEHLTLPHPRMLKRGFVLLPASEIDQKWLRYVRKLPIADIQATRYVGQW